MNQRLKTALLHSGLFIATFITTTVAGASWSYNRFIVLEDFSPNPDYGWDDFAMGLPYSITLMLILTVHEFGHYFAAMYHKVKTTLPYYIPLPPPFLLGTLGALIRIKTRMHTTTQNFDIGIAGPLAGFVVAIAALFYGFATLPEPEYIFQVHPEYEQYGADYAEHVYKPEFIGENSDFVIGNNMLFWFFENYVADPARVPNHHELMHYPVLLAAFLSLLLTAINLLPIGQLDGGHVLYGLIGWRRQKIVASIAFVLFLFYSTLGMLVPREEMNFLGFYTLPHYASIVVIVALLFFCLKALRLSQINTMMIAVGMFAVQYLLTSFFPTLKGYSGWLVFAIIIGRMMPAAHPPVEIEEPLTPGRQILGWIALLIFILCFAPRPFEIISPAAMP